MKSSELLQSAITVRIMSLCGVIPENTPSIKSPPFALDDDIFAYKINIDEESYLGFLYKENKDIKILGIKMFFTSQETIWGWYFIVCGDETGETFESNNIFGEIDKKHLHIPENNKNNFEILELAPSRAVKLLMGIESVWEHMPVFSKFVPDELSLKKFKQFVESIDVEFCEEE